MTSLADNLVRKLRELDEQYADIEAKLLDPEVLVDHRMVRSLSIRKAALQSIVDRFRNWSGCEARSEHR